MIKQQGITLIGMVFTIAIVVMLAVLTMRIVPVYLQNYEINSSIKALEGVDPSLFSDDYSSNALLLRKKLTSQLDVNGITIITSNQIKVVPSNNKPGSYRISIKYTVIKPLIANLSLLFDFDNVNEVTIGSN